MFGVTLSRPQQEPRQKDMLQTAHNPEPPSARTGEGGSKAASSIPRSRWMSAGCGWEPELFRSQRGPRPSRILGFCSADPSGSPGAGRVFLGTEGGSKPWIEGGRLRPQCAFPNQAQTVFPSLPILPPSMVGIFSFIKNLLIIPAAWSWAAAWN